MSPSQDVVKGNTVQSNNDTGTTPSVEGVWYTRDVLTGSEM
jgi:hypothetical protein